MGLGKSDCGNRTLSRATEEERLISDIKLVSTATVGRINDTSHVYFTV
jgi:hypothetical protein